MCEFSPIRHHGFRNHPGPIDSILRTPDNGKYYLSPVYDLVASIVHNRVG